jgi:RHS repeat-associated protein
MNTSERDRRSVDGGRVSDRRSVDGGRVALYPGEGRGSKPLRSCAATARRGVTFFSSKLVLLVTLVLAACSSGGGGSLRDSLTPSAGSAPAFTSKLRIVPGLAEPLVTTKATTEAEDRDLDQATSGRYGAEAPLLAFVAGHPDSGWNAAIHTNLGLAYYRQAFFSKAVAVYEAAWKEGREATDFRAKTLVDRAVAELAKMHARVGHLKELDALIAELGDRSIQGGASELITGAKEGAWTMRHDPGVSYLCGPKALGNVLETLGASPAAVALAEAARSGEHGFSLAQLGELADRAGLAHRLVHREPGQPVPVPSVINWKVSHYAAIVGKIGTDRYKIMDPTFGEDLEISEAAIDEEGSGFFLVPARAGEGDHDDLRLAWREATPGEAQKTYGMGFPSSYVLGAVTGADFRSGVFGADEDALWNPSQTVECTTCGNISSGGMPVPDAHAMEVSLNLNDTPVGYAPPVGPPAYIRLSYNQREAVEPYGPPSNPVSFNVGPQWTLNVLSYVLDDPESPGVGVSRYVPGGGAVSGYTDYSYSTGAFDPEKQTGATLVRAPATGMATSYTLTGTDGSRLVYAQNDGSTSAATYRRLFLTSIVDPQGNALTLNYDTTLPAPDAGADGGPSGFGSAAFYPRLSSITDPTGTTTTAFTYGLSATPLLVTQIMDAFGRSASIAYDTNGRLSSIEDVMGLTSTVAYDDGNSPPRPTFIKQLTTPYGNTTFNYGETNSGSAVVTRWLETTDPLGQTERLEFMEQAPGIPGADETGASLPLPSGMPLTFGTGYMIYRNSFFWNKHIYKTYGTGTGKDYTKAELVHWLHTNNGQYVAPTIESVRHPLEHRTWYQYTPGQSNSIDEGPSSTYLGAPTTTARVLDDGSTQLTSTTRNRLGKPLLVTDALGRQTEVTYGADGTDLLVVRQKISGAGFGLLGAYTYNGQHEPLTYTDASGETTRYGYNPAGQLLTVTDTLGHVRTVAYDGSGRVSKLIDANNQPVVTLAYDSANRVATRTDSVGYTLSYAYDNFDRVTQVTYPDKTTETYVYTNLDLTSATDRIGQKTTYGYDPNGRLTKVTDPASNVTQYAYYEDGTLETLTDPNGNVTTWAVDIQGRPVQKTYADGTTETYAYESSTSRLHSRTDGLGQVTTYAYGTDGSLSGVSYSGPGAGSSTPAVSFAYDTELPRITSMTDSVGTTSYVYYPMAAAPAVDGGAAQDAGATLPPVPVAPGAGRLQAVLSPVAGAAAGTVDTVSYSYDALGRVSGRGVNGVAQTVAFDALGRPTAVANALDSFAYGYSDETPRVTGVASANGPSVALSYWEAASHPEQNELLKQMTYAAGGAATDGGASGRILSQFGYAYYPNGNVETFTEAHAAPAASSADAGAPNDSGGATGMMLPRLRKSGHGMGGSGSAWTRTRLGGQGSAGVLILAAALLFGALGWMHAGKGRVASALTPVALGLVFAACSGGSNNGGGHGPGGGSAEGDSGGSSSAGLQTQFTAYKYDAASRLTSATLGSNGMPPAPSATPQFAYKYDAASNPTSIAASGATQTPSYTSTNEIGGGTYDLNGSPTSLGGASYAWDAASRLVSATVGGVESDFTYDGSSRLVRIVEKQGGSVTSDKAYTWAGTTRVLEHDNATSGSPASKQYFAQGVVDGGQTYYYAADRLRSVRQLVDGSGAIRAQYSYDPYGNRTRSEGDQDADVGYAGYFWHAPSGLALTMHRAYDPGQGRWLNRDPIGEPGGSNLYAYVGGDPVNAIDPSGLLTTVTDVYGTTTTFGTAAALLDYLKTAPYFSITNINFAGHANPGLQGIDDVNPPQEYIREDEYGNVQVGGDSLGTDEVMLGTLLTNKMASGATIGEMGCNAAANHENIVRATSRDVPDVSVSGSALKTTGPTPSTQNSHEPLSQFTYENGSLQSLSW